MERKSISHRVAASTYERTNESHTAPASFLSLPPGTEIVVYVAFSPLPESTECAKVIAALDSRRIQYSLELVPTGAPPSLLQSSPADSPGCLPVAGRMLTQLPAYRCLLPLTCPPTVVAVMPSRRCRCCFL